MTQTIVPKKKKPPTLEQIIDKTQKANDKVNKKHPERNGYGLLQEEGEEYIKMMTALARREDHAHREKTVNRVERVCVLSQDKLYTHSPEEILLAKERDKALRRTIERVRDSMSERDKQVYDGYVLDRLSQQEIADKLEISQSSVSRILANAEQIMDGARKVIPAYE